MKCKIYSMLFISMLLNLCVQIYAEWSSTNFPGYSKVNTMAVHDSCIYAGTVGEGIFVSTNNGDSWNEINDGLKSMCIHKIFINDRTVYAGTEDGAYVLSNDGLTWREISNGLSGQGVWSFAVNNSNGILKIFAGTDNGVFATTDNGENWAVYYQSNTIMPVHSIVICREYVYAATFSDGIYYSSDNGVTWTKTTIDITGENYLPESKGIVPVSSFESLSKLVIAGGWNGCFYYSDCVSATFLLSSPANPRFYPINCLSKYNDVIFAVSNSGLFYKLKVLKDQDNNEALDWKDFNLRLSDGNKNEVYSLSANDTYLFAANSLGIWRNKHGLTPTNVENTDNPSNDFILGQNYPNPFNASTKIKFTVNGNERVSLKVYNVMLKLKIDFLKI